MTNATETTHPAAKAAVAVALVSGLVALGLVNASAASASAASASASDNEQIITITPVNCSTGGFTGRATIIGSRNTESGVISYSVSEYSITAPEGSKTRSEANVSIQTAQTSLVPGQWTFESGWKELSSTLRQDGEKHALNAGVALSNLPRKFNAVLSFTFDAPGSEPSCNTVWTQDLITEIPAVANSVTCSVTAGDTDQACWRAEQDSVVAIEVTDWGVKHPEYLVLNRDGSVNHRARFSDTTLSRIWLQAGQSIALTPPNFAGQTNTIAAFAVRTFAEGAQPEVGEKCIATDHADTGCFAVSSRNYELQVIVTDTPRGNAPEYYVARDGVIKHGGLLEMDDDGSRIWIEAGDQFFLTSPWYANEKNIIQLRNVTQY